MTIRIRELVVRAEIGSGPDAEERRNERPSASAPSSTSEKGRLTRRFYEEDPIKENER